MKDHKEQYIDNLLITFDEMGFAPTTPCTDPEKCAIEWRETVRTEFERLENENAALRERLDKAVEFPFENLDKVFILAGEYTKAKQFIPDRIVEGTIVGFGYDIYEWADGNYKFNYHVLVGENNYIFALEQFNKTLFKTREAAEARLKEMKEEQ